MSSNGGVSRFMKMYHVRSPGSECSRPFRSGLVRYCCSTGAGGVLAHEPSSAPAWILLKMSSVLVSISMSTPSMLFDRTSGLSVAGS